MSSQIVNVEWKRKNFWQNKVSEIRVSKIRVSEIRGSKIRGSEIRGSEIRVSEIRISSNHRELHGAIFCIRAPWGLNDAKLDPFEIQSGSHHYRPSCQDPPEVFWQHLYDGAKLPYAAQTTAGQSCLHDCAVQKTAKYNKVQLGCLQTGRRQNFWHAGQNFEVQVSKSTWRPMESIKLSVQTDHKFLRRASIFWSCVTNVKTLNGFRLTRLTAWLGRFFVCTSAF